MQIDTSTPTEHRQINARAYSLWEQAGRPQGRDTEFWLQAEKETAHEAATPSLSRESPPARRPRPVSVTKRAAQSRVGAPIKAAWQI